MLLLINILFWISLGILFYCYAGYSILAMLMIGMRKLFAAKKNIPEPGDYLPVTMIITSYNEEGILEQKISNICDLDYPEHLLKIIFVTDGSDDHSAEIVSRYPFINLLHQKERKGKYAAIKRAMRRVETPVVIFSDANTMLNRDAVKRMVVHYNNKKTGGVAGEKKIVVNKHTSAVGQGEGLYWLYESFMKKLDAELYTVIGAAGELFSIRTSLFKEFPDDLIIDDFVISMQICLQGYTIAYEPVAFASELPSASLAEEEKRKIRISAGAYQSIGYLKECLNFWQHPLLSFQFISRRVLRWLFCPLMLLIFFTANLLIVLHYPSPFYNTVFFLQVLFYVMAFAGWLFIRGGRRTGIFTVPFYFVFMNYCLIRGLFKYLKGRQTVLWEKSLRQAI